MKTINNTFFNINNSIPHLICKYLYEKNEINLGNK